MRCSGLELSSAGCHVLRHSFAVHLLRREVSMHAIGGTLGHRAPESTAVYLRLAIEDLRAVGLPVLVGGRPTALVEDWEAKLPRARTQPRQRLSPGDFRSRLAAPLCAYLKHRRALGRLYSVEEGILRRWDDFLHRHYPTHREVQAQLFQRWASSMPGLCPMVLRNHLRIVRNFLLFHARHHPKTYIPGPETFPRTSAAFFWKNRGLFRSLPRRSGISP
ncbi:MAG TPA: tyrosine-type recombinase/integrase [Terrimicrobiaceae bacterium]